MTVDWDRLLGTPLVGTVDAVALPDGDADFEWRDEDGALVAAFRRDGGGARIDVIDVGVVTVSAGGDVTAAALPECGDVLLDAFDRFGRPALAHAMGAEVLHASAVRAGGGVVAFSGPGGAGKSTLACELVARGFEPWADDTVAITWRGDAPYTTALPFRFRVGGGRPGRARGGAAVEAPLVDVVVLAAGDACAVADLDGVAAVRALVPQAFAFAGSARDRGQRVFDAYTRLVSRVRVRQLSAPLSAARIEFAEAMLRGG